MYSFVRKIQKQTSEELKKLKSVVVLKGDEPKEKTDKPTKDDKDKK